MTVLPSASIPYLKHSEFGNLQAGVIESQGSLSEIYHRYLHTTRNLVWQQSAYYFAIRKDFEPTCKEIVTNPYTAVLRLTRGTFARSQSRDCSRQSDEQRGILWKPDGKFETLDDDARDAMFPNAAHPPKGRTFGVWAMHHIREGTETLLWTPQMVNKWLQANEANCSMLIEFPQHYFSELKAQRSTVSLELHGPVDVSVTRQLDAGTRWYKPRLPRLLSPLSSPRPRSASTHSTISYDSRADSTWSVGSPDEFSIYESSLLSTSDNVEYDVPEADDQCMCAECIELYKELAEALELSEQDKILQDQQRQMLDDENMARAIAMSEDERANSLSRAAESEDAIYAALLQSRDEESALQQIRDDEALARQLSEGSASEIPIQPTVLAGPPLHTLDSRASIESLYNTSSCGRQRSSSPIRSEAFSAFDMPTDPPSYEASLSGCSQLPSYAAAPA